MSDEPNDVGTEGTFREPENSPSLDERIVKLKGFVINMFCVYAAAITLLRGFGLGRLAMGLVESYTLRGMKGMTLGGWLFTAMPVIIAIYVSKTRLAARWLMCVQYFALFAMLNHLAYLAVFMANFGWAMALSLSYAMIGPFIMAGLALYMFILFVNARDLAKLEHEKEPSRSAGENDYLRCIIVFLVFLVSPLLSFHISDMLGAVWDFLPFGKVRTIMEEECGTSNSNGSTLCLSPDGRLLAVVGMRGMSVMDAKSLKLIFEDLSIGGMSGCFSPDGKYLAVVGEHIPFRKYDIKEVRSNPNENLGALALYDVENGFRRIEEVSIPPDADPRRKTFVVSVAFRPDGKSLLCLYYSYWDQKLFDSEEFKELLTRENNIPITWMPLCREIATPSGEIIHEERIARKMEKSLITFRFSPDASTLAYIHGFVEKRLGGAKRNISLIDTRTWNERVFYQKDPKYRMVALYPGLVADLGKLYFHYKHVHIRELPDGQIYVTPHESVLGELDINSFSSRDIIDSNVALPAYRLMRGRKETFFLGFAISPDRHKAALLGSVQESRDQWKSNNFEFFIVIVNLNGEPRPRLHRYRLGFNKYDVMGINWFTEKQLTLSATNYDAKIFHIDLDGWEE
jgi:hypothetical protein